MSEIDKANQAIGESWQSDSSLEKWFPFTAEQIIQKDAEIAALKARLRHQEAQLARATEQESDAGIYFARCQQHAERIAALEALIADCPECSAVLKAYEPKS